MNVSEFRQQYPEYNDIPDDSLAARLYERHKDAYSDMTEQEFKKRFLSGASARPSASPAGTTSTRGQAPDFLHPRMGDVFMAVPKLGLSMAKSFAEDVASVPQAMIGDPLAQAERAIRGIGERDPAKRLANATATPQEIERERRATAAMAGTLAAGPAEALAAKGLGRLGLTAARPALSRVLRGIAGGGVAGGVDAPIRTGDPAQAVPGFVTGSVLGPVVGEFFHRALPARPEVPPSWTSEPPADLGVWSAGLEAEGPSPYRVGGGQGAIPPWVRERNANALEGLYGGANEGQVVESATPTYRDRMALQRTYQAPPPRRPREAPAPMALEPPEDVASKIARSPFGPIVSSVEDRLKAIGRPGGQMARLVNRVADEAPQSQGKYLQPFDKALHAVTGKKAMLPEADRSAIRNVLEGRAKESSIPERIRPIYDQMKAYFKEMPARATEVGATVPRKVNGRTERVPFAQVAREHYYPHRQVSVDDLVKDKDLRDSMANNLVDMGIAATPEEGLATVWDHIQYAKSQGKKGGQLAIRATKKLNPGMSDKDVANYLINRQPQLRQPAGSLEHERLVNSPFFEPRPEIAFPQHVVETEQGLSEIRHYGQDAEKLKRLLAALPASEQREAEHLLRTATESHAPWDPKVEGTLAKLRAAQLGLFTPITSAKNLSQRNNTLLASDLAEGLRFGYVPTKKSADIAARSGALAEGSHENLAQALNANPGFFGKWLKTIGFTSAERGNRQGAARAGAEEAAKYAARLGKNPNDALARYRLEREGINPEKVAGGKLAPEQETQAALRRSNLSQFRSHPLDLPDWFSSNPYTRTAATFKGFDYQQTRLILDETLGRMSSGQPGDKARAARNLAILAAVYPAVGEVVNTVYAVILRRESPQHVAARTKEFIDDTAKVVSGGMTPVDYGKKYAARYGKNVLAGSAPGAGGTLVQALEFGQGDRGASALKAAAGPAYSRPFEAMQLAYDVNTQKKKGTGEAKPMTPAQKRQALKLILGGAGTMLAPWLYPPKNAAGEGGPKR